MNRLLSVIYLMLSLASIPLLVITGLPELINTAAQTNEQRTLIQRKGTIEAWPSIDKRFALIIGVDEYQDSQINRLQGASNDAKALSDVLIQYGGFLSEQVTLLTSAPSSELQATRGNILRRLSNLRPFLSKDSLLLFFFAGHGIERNGHAYLLPTDAQVSGDISLVEETAVSAELIKEWIRQSNAGQVVMIIDACRNNPEAGRGDSKKAMTELYSRAFNFDSRNQEIKAFATIYATEVGQVAYEYKEKKQGFFTWTLVEGLKGKAANEKGEVTLASLIKYIQVAVPKRVQLELGQGKNQRPFAIVEGYKADDLVLTAVRREPSESANGQPIKRDDPGATELEYWDAIKHSNNPDEFKAYIEQYPNGKFASLARVRAYPTTVTEQRNAERDINTSNISIVSGYWEGTYGPGSFPFAMKLKQDGETITGEHVSDGITSQIITGKLIRNELTLDFIYKKNRIRMTAKLKGETFTGNKFIDDNSTPLKWMAVRKGPL